MNKYHTLILLLSGIVLSVFLLLFLAYRPASAQANELFRLYFDIDYVRKNSAEVFAELLEAKNTPERVNTTEQIGKPKPLSDPLILKEKMKANRKEVQNALSTINEKSFTDERVSRTHELVKVFYQNLAEFEDKTIQELDEIVKDDHVAFGQYITNTFEGEDWSSLLAQDASLRQALENLASAYLLSFQADSYDSIFRSKLATLAEPITTKEQGGAYYTFTVSEPLTEAANVTASSTTPIDKFTFFFVNPEGKRVDLPITRDTNNPPTFDTSFGWKVGEYDMVFKLFKNDPAVQPIMGEWKIAAIGPGGSEVVFGASHY